MPPPSDQRSALAPLPPGFADHFTTEALAKESSTLVAVDPHGKILWTNPAWQRFAQENAGHDVLTRYGVGSSYYDGIGTELRDYYVSAFHDALAQRQVFEQDYECSSPDLQRLMRLRVLPIPDSGLLLEHTCVAELAHPDAGASAVEERYLNTHGVIVQCSNCRRIRRKEEPVWDWVPTWVSSPHAAISHGLCAVCTGFYWGRRLRGAR
jgi:hypothetical protein